MSQQQDKKSELRDDYLARRSQLTPSDCRRASGQVVEYLDGLTLPDKKATLAGYCATDNEIEVAPFLFDGARRFDLVLPKVLSQCDMGFFPVESRDELSPGFGGILEPNEKSQPAVELEQIDIFLVPGLAFDVFGNRLGFGGGYYDRVLPSSCRKRKLKILRGEHTAASLTDSTLPFRIGICHDWQIRDKKLPVEAHDVSMDMLITNENIYCSPEFESGKTDV